MPLIIRLDGLWQRGAWLSYFFLIVALTFLTFLISHFLERLLASRASYSPLGSPSIDLAPTRPRPPHPVLGFFKRIWGSWKHIESTVLSRMEITFSKTDDARIVWLEGMGWAVAGGSLAGLCLVFTKAIVKIFGNPGHPVNTKPPLAAKHTLIRTATPSVGHNHPRDGHRHGCLSDHMS